MITVADFSAVVNQVLPEPHAGLLNGIIFGTKASLSKDFLQALITTGTLHIVALSGMNISILVGVMQKTLLRVAPRRVTHLLTMLLIAGFVWFVGPTPSVIRAAVMGSLVLLSTILGRQNWTILTFILTCGIILLVKPSWLFDLSFQLSAFATLGIILFGNNVGEANQKTNIFWQFIENDLRVTLAAQVFTIPLILFTFGRMSLISPVTNVLIGWTIPILTPLGMLIAITGWIFLPVGQLLAYVAWMLLQYLIVVINFTANIPFTSIGR